MIVDVFTRESVAINGARAALSSDSSGRLQRISTAQLQIFLHLRPPRAIPRHSMETRWRSGLSEPQRIAGSDKGTSGVSCEFCARSGYMGPTRRPALVWRPHPRHTTVGRIRGSRTHDKLPAICGRGIDRSSCHSRGSSRADKFRDGPHSRAIAVADSRGEKLRRRGH